MKYIIIGFHASGKKEIVDDLSQNGVKVGKCFVSLPNPQPQTYLPGTIYYPHNDIDDLFENQAYLFIEENTEGPVSYYQGLSLYEFDNNDVFMLTPPQFNLIPKFPKDVCIIWLDNNVNERRIRFLNERRKYDFVSQENLEKQDINEFIDKINDSKHLLYFNNEDPLRVSAIIYSLVKYPSLLKFYEKRFN